MASYGLTPRILVPALGGGLYFLIAHYVFSDLDAEDYAIWLTVVAGGILILQYFFQRFRGILPRALISVLAGALFYLIAHYVFAYHNAERYGISITAVSGGFAVLNIISKEFRGILPRILITLLGGGLSYLIAQYAFSYSDATRLGLFITAASGGFFIFRYLWSDSRDADSTAT